MLDLKIHTSQMFLAIGYSVVNPLRLLNPLGYNTYIIYSILTKYNFNSFGFTLRHKGRRVEKASALSVMNKM